MSFDFHYRQAMPNKVCPNVICDKIGGKKCTRCCIVYYCSKECQIADWKRHKVTCFPPGQAPSNNDAIKAKIATQEKSRTCDTEKPTKEYMQTIISKLKLLKREEAEYFCATCGEPGLCVTNSIKKCDDGGPGKTGSAIFLCKKMHQSANSDASLGEELECTCPETEPLKILTVNPELFKREFEYPYDYPSTPRILLLTGLQIRGNDGAYTKKLVSKTYKSINTI